MAIIYFSIWPDFNVLVFYFIAYGFFGDEAIWKLDKIFSGFDSVLMLFSDNRKLSIT